MVFSVVGFFVEVRSVARFEVGLRVVIFALLALAGFGVITLAAEEIDISVVNVVDSAEDSRVGSVEVSVELVESSSSLVVESAEVRYSVVDVVDVSSS